MALVLSGALTIDGPGVTVRLSAAEDGPATLTVEGAFVPGRRAIGEIASRAVRSGLALTVRDGRGRRLAAVGPDVRSPLGRLLLGSARVRPTLGGLLAALRGSAARHTTDDGGGSA